MLLRRAAAFHLLPVASSWHPQSVLLWALAVLADAPAPVIGALSAGYVTNRQRFLAGPAPSAVVLLLDE